MAREPEVGFPVIERQRIERIAQSYDKGAIKVACIGSHSALDICDGAIEEGLRTLVVAQRGRDRTFSHFFQAKRVGERVVRGVVDDCWVLEKYSDVLRPEHQDRLRRSNAVFIPNRSFTSYASVDDIEDVFAVPLFGSRAMLRIEERGHARDYYHLLEKAGIPFPEKTGAPQNLDTLAIVKLPHAQKKLERGFFTAASPGEYQEKAEHLIRAGVIEKADLAKARIERYIIGPIFNLNFFYS